MDRGGGVEANTLMGGLAVVTAAAQRERAARRGDCGISIVLSRKVMRR